LRFFSIQRGRFLYNQDMKKLCTAFKKLKEMFFGFEQNQMVEATFKTMLADDMGVEKDDHIQKSIGDEAKTIENEMALEINAESLKEMHDGSSMEAKIGHG